MKTITFSGDQVACLSGAAVAVIDFLEGVIREGEGLPASLLDARLMYLRDQLDVARKALALLEG